MKNQRLIHGNIVPAAGAKQFCAAEEAEKFKRITWAEYIKTALGFDTYYAVQKHFSGADKFKHKSTGTNHPTDWYKYANGTRSPSKKTRLRAESEVPSSEYIHNMPLWTLTIKPVSEEYIHDSLLQASPDIKKRLFERSGSNGIDWVRKGTHNQDHFHTFLRRKGTIDALNTVLLLLAEDEFHFSVVHFVSRRACLISTMRNVCTFPPFDNEDIIYFLYGSIIKRFFIPLQLPKELSFIDRYQWASPHHMVRWVRTNKNILEYLKLKKVIGTNPNRQQILNILNKLYELPKKKSQRIYVDMMLHNMKSPEYDPNTKTHLALLD